MYQPRECRYVQFFDIQAIAGIVTAANADMYTSICVEAQRLMFSLARSPSALKKLPTFFTMMGGPAIGSRGLQTVIKSAPSSDFRLQLLSLPIAS
jgi:hypothetical protein